MYKIMIVDDEEPVLNSFAYMVEKSETDFQVAALARSGFEAISLAHRERPDLVFMDIGMPGIDGLETIKELQRSYPEMIFVLSTAYERFDLAKKAIPLGVFEYLVKPISKKRFLETLEKARLHLEELKELAASRLDGKKLSADSLSWEEKNFLLTITWKALDEREWEGYRELFDLPSEKASILLVKLDGGSDEEREECRRDLLRRLSRRYQHLSTDYLGKLLIFLPGDLEREAIEGYLDELFAGCPGGLKVSCGYGGVHSYHEFFRSCSEALAAFPEEDEEHENEEHREISGLRKRIHRAEGFDEALAEFSRHSERVFSACTFQVAKARMIALFTLLLEDLERSHGGDTPPRRLFDPAREIIEIESREEWEAWSGRALRMIVEAEHLFREEHLPAALKRAIFYIRGNYEKPLQLADAAEACGVSSGYLSRLFGDQLGLSFIDYLTQVRMRVAEDLLVENKLPIKEIAYAVGYQDPNYFSRIFKRQKGIAPTSYLQEKRDE